MENKSKITFKNHVKNVFKVILINIVIFIVFMYIYQILGRYVSIFHTYYCYGLCPAYYDGHTDAQIWLSISMTLVGSILTILLSMKFLKIKFWMSVLYFVISIVVSFVIGMILGLLLSMFSF